MIKPKIIENIAVIYVESDFSRGQLQENLEYLKKNEAEFSSNKSLIGISYSFTNVTTIEEAILKDFISFLKMYSTNSGILVSFMEYQDELYELLKNLATENISLFKTFEIAKVFYSVLTPSKETTVIICDEEMAHGKKIKEYLMGRGCKTLEVSSKRDMKAIASKEANKFLIYDTSVPFLDKMVKTTLLNNMLIITLTASLDRKFGLFFNKPRFLGLLQKEGRVVVFDITQLSSVNQEGFAIMVELISDIAKFGSKIYFSGTVKFPSVLKEQFQNKGVVFVDSLTKIPEQATTPQANKADNSKLTKSIVATVPRIIDATWDTFSLVAKKEIKKIFHKISTFSVEHSENYVANTFELSGEAEGRVIIVYDKEIAKIATRLIVGKESLLPDSINQISHTISTKITKLSKENDSTFECTEFVAFDNIAPLKATMGNRGGVMILLEIDTKFLYIFVTSK